MWKRLRNARLIWPSLSAMAGVAMLAGLGIWQLERLQWKEALIARIGERASAPPVLLEAALERWRSTRDVEYLHVRATGQFQHDKERFLYAPGTSALGWHVYTPFQTSAGPILWVNRGWVDDPHKLPQRRAAGQIAGETEVRGLLRVAGEPGLFTPANDAERNLWYWPDLAGMTASAYGPATADVLPFRLEADAEPAAPGGLPRGGVTRIALPNRHLEYAVTWFGLALTLIAVYSAFARARLRLAQATK